MPTDRDIISDIDTDATDPTSIENRLSAALNVQRVVTKRLTTVQPYYPNPGPPTGPTTLQAIITEAQGVIALCNQMMGR